ncbi:MAG: sulfurtransferase TusA family protein [Desulfosarcinaceae bacterium]|jgi:TusA-related sulfurtransferase
MVRIDLHNTIVPFSLLQIANHFKQMRAGEVIRVVGADKRLAATLQALLPKQSCELTWDGEDNPSHPFNTVVIKKTEAPRNDKKEKIMSDVDLNSVEVASCVDARGSACPGPLLEAKKGIGKVRVGEILEIYSNDSGTRTDIPAWSNKVGHEYLGVLEADGYDKHFVRRTK